MYSLTQTVAPSAEPITRAEAKTHLRIDGDITDQDTLIDALIKAGRGWIENYCRRSLVRRTYELRMDNWPPEFRLPMGPVSSVSGITYIDAGGTQRTLATDQYQVDTNSTPPRITPEYGVVWPFVKPGRVNAIVVTYVAGYAPSSDSPTDHAANVPQEIKAALKILVSTFYENRESYVVGTLPPQEAPFAVKALLAPYEIRDFTLE